MTHSITAPTTKDKNDIRDENETIKNGVSNEAPIEPLNVMAVIHKNIRIADSIIVNDRLIALNFLKFIIKMLMNFR